MAMISKMVLMTVAVVLIAFSPATAWEDSGAYERGRSDGESIERARQAPSPDQEKRDKQRFQWEKQDREKAETRANDGARESAYSQSKAANKSKVNKMRKKAGLKSHNSWQLTH